MREVRLWLPEEKSIFGDALLKELKELDGSAKVYYTYCHDVDPITSAYASPTNYILMTSSKDVHLGIGRLSKIGLSQLCRLLKNECIRGSRRGCQDEVFLLFVEQKSGGGLLVTRSTDPEGNEVYHLSPAH